MESSTQNLKYQRISVWICCYNWKPANQVLIFFEIQYQLTAFSSPLRSIQSINVLTILQIWGSDTQLPRNLHIHIPLEALECAQIQQQVFTKCSMRWLKRKLLANLSDQVNGIDTMHLPSTRGIITIFSMISQRNIKLTIYNPALLHTNFLECTHRHQQHSDQKRGSSLCPAACPAFVHN